MMLPPSQQDLHSYERPLAVSPFGTIEQVPDWDDTYAVALDARHQLWPWMRDLSLEKVHGLVMI